MDGILDVNIAIYTTFLYYYVLMHVASSSYDTTISFY